MRERSKMALSFVLSAWTEVVSFARNPIGRVVLAIVALVGTAAVLAAALQTSYVHPGPAIFIGGLAVVILLSGWVIRDLWSARYGRPTRVLGLELVFERWRDFEPEERDSEILSAQISLAQSVAELEYARLNAIQIIQAFPGIKLERATFLVQPGGRDPFVLKLDSVAEIGHEERRYRDCIHGLFTLVPGEPRKLKQRNVIIRNELWGAIGYNLLGAPAGLQTLGAYYGTVDTPRQIERAFNQVIEALHPLWRSVAPSGEDCARWSHETLYDEYDRLNKKRNEMMEGITRVGQVLQIAALQGITTSQRHVELGSDVTLRNPLNWIEDVFARRGLGDWTELRRDSVVHGDFHAGNILIEDRSGLLGAWIIDFAHTHFGPTVQDLARLEADVKFGLIPGETLQSHSLHELIDFETNLLPESEQPTLPLSALVPGQKEPGDSQLRKGGRAVCLLRKEAKRYLIGDDARPYYLALLHATLPTLYYRDRTPLQKVYAFISGALLCQRLRG